MAAANPQKAALAWAASDLPALGPLYPGLDDDLARFAWGTSFWVPQRLDGPANCQNVLERRACACSLVVCLVLGQVHLEQSKAPQSTALPFFSQAVRNSVVSFSTAVLFVHRSRISSHLTQASPAAPSPSPPASLAPFRPLGSASLMTFVCRAPCGGSF